MPLPPFLDRTPRQMVQALRRLGRREARLAGFDARHPCVFVLSTGRAGTQTVAALLGLAPHLLAHHEPEPLLYALGKAAYAVTEESEETRALLAEAFLTARRALLEDALRAGRGYAESSPQVTFLAPAIHRALPEARFLHLVRDPRHVVRSAMRRKWYDGHPWDNRRVVPHAGTEAAQAWAGYSPFQKNVWLWAETNRWIARFTASLPPDQWLRLSAESLFTGEEASLRQLFALVGAPLPPTGRIERVLGKRLNAQRTGAFPLPDEWTGAMRAELRAMAGDTAQALGYDLTEPL